MARPIHSNPRPIINPNANDSLSRCDHSSYSSLYSVNNHPNIKRESVTSAPVKDTLELKSKLEKEALSRLRHTSKLAISQPGFMRVGKYLFLGVALPPYLIIYKIPKWVIVVMVPAIFSFLGSTVNKVTNKIKKKVEAIVHRLQVVLQRMQQKLNILIQPLVRLGLEIKNGMKRIRENVLGLVYRFTTVLKAPIKKIQKGSDKIKAIFKKIGELPVQVQQFINSSVLAIANTWKEGMQWLKQNPLKNFKENPRVFAATQMFSGVATAFLASLRTSKNLANKTTNWVVDQFSRGGRYIRKHFDQMRKYHQAYLAPVLKEVQTKVKTRLLRIGHFLKRRSNGLKQLIERVLSYLKGLGSNQYFINASLLWLPASIRERTRQFLKHPLTQKSIQLGFKAIYSLFNGLWMGSLWLFRMLRQLLEVVFKFIKEAVKQIKSVLQASLDYSTIGLAFFGKVARVGFYQFLVLMMMGFILIMWGFRYLGNKTSAKTGTSV